MRSMDAIIDNEYSSLIIGEIDLKCDKMCRMVSEQMGTERYSEIEESLRTFLIDVTKDYFVKGFLRGMAAVKSGVAFKVNEA